MAPAGAGELGSAASASDAPYERYASAPGGAVGAEDRIFEGKL